MVRQKNVGQCLGVLDDVIALWKQIGRAPKGKDRLPTIFRGEMSNFGGVFLGGRKMKNFAQMSSL